MFYGSIYKFIKRVNELEEFKYCYHIVTFEQQEYLIDNATQAKLNKEFGAYNITHYPLNWGDSFLKKIANILIGFKVIKKINKKYNANLIVTLGSVAASFVLLYSKILPLKIIAHTFEPHSLFLLETHFFTKSNFKYKLLNYLETQVIKKACCIMTGTDNYKDIILSINPTANVLIVPSNVDESWFCINKEQREVIRKHLDIQNKVVFVYSGKFGGIYYDNEIISLFRILKNEFSDAFFLVLTPNDKNEITKLFMENNFSSSDYYIDKILYDQVPNYLNAADFGIVAIPPTPAQKYRSPIKVGEYLMCGLPYLVCKGISNDDTCATDNNVGVVVDDFSVENLKNSVPSIKKILEENKEELSMRCRKVGIAYRGINNSIDAFRNTFQNN